MRYQLDHEKLDVYQIELRSITRHAAQRPVSVYPGLKALAGFRLKPVLRRRGLRR